jgi:hypothetical protein
MLADGKLDVHYVRILRNLFREANCVLTCNHEETAFRRRVGVPQGSLLAPFVFNVGISHIVNQVMEGESNTVDFLYADDVALINFGTDDSDMQRVIRKFTAIAKSANLQLNVSKCQILHSYCPRPVISVDNVEIPVVTQAKYLGVIISANGDQGLETEARLASAERAYFGMHKFFSNRSVSMEIKLQVYSSTVRPILMYQCGLWAKWDERIGVFDRHCLRKIVKGHKPPDPSKGVPFWRCISNEEMRARTARPEAKALCRRERLKWVGHLSRMPTSYARNLMHSITQHLDGFKRKPGGQKRTWIEQVAIDLNQQSLPLPNVWRNIIRRAADREKWRAFVNLGEA